VGQLLKLCKLLLDFIAKLSALLQMAPCRTRGFDVTPQVECLQKYHELF
jgi:hypothetical protein